MKLGKFSRKEEINISQRTIDETRAISERMEKEREYIPLDQWQEEKVPDLYKNIYTHVEVMTEDILDSDKKYSLIRLIMGSIRDEFGNKL